MKKQISQSVVLFALALSISACSSQSQDSHVALEESFGALQSSENASDWESSPSNFHSKLDELKESNTTSAEFCEALMKRSDEEMVLISDEFKSGEHDALVADCSADLKARVAKYFSAHTVAQDKSTAKRIKTVTRVFDPRKIRYIKGNEDFLKDKEVILTFDDGPIVETSSQIVATLARYNDAKAMFFMVGARVKNAANAKYAQHIWQSGHTVGSHSMNHLGTRSAYAKEGAAAVDREIFKAHDLIATKVSYMSPYMRFPGGTSNADIDALVWREGLSIWHWNMDSLDFKTPNPKEIVQRVTKLLERHKKGVLLFHDIKQQTALALPEIMKYLEDNGYTLVLPVDK
jgi:Predicted xylanase/chitin deacetylase